MRRTFTSVLAMVALMIFTGTVQARGRCCKQRCQNSTYRNYQSSQMFYQNSVQTLPSSPVRVTPTQSCPNGTCPMQSKPAPFVTLN